MKRSIYSLVLTDEVVKEIDKLAAERGMSRSNMANQILADYVSYTTPEKRIREIFTGMESLFNETGILRNVEHRSNSALTVRGALTYKYNPTVRYAVELSGAPLPEIGILRVSVRSKNAVLQLYMCDFFATWSEIEKKHVGNVEFVLTEEKYSRRLVVREAVKGSNTSIGRSISEYIGLMDRCMNIYFLNLNKRESAVGQIDALFGEYAAGTPVVI